MNKITGIGLTGFMKSGKDSFSDFFITQFHYNRPTTKIEHFAFAGALKQFCMQFLGLTQSDVHTQEGKEKFNTFWGMTNREILQRVGTDALRNGFHQDIWTKILELQLLEVINDETFFIVTDVRFPNEAEMIRRVGGIVVKIDRKEVTPSDLTKLHPSEQPINEKLIDFVVDNNTGFNNLSKEATRILNLCM